MNDAHDGEQLTRPERECLFSEALVRAASRHPDREFLCEVSGPRYTYGQTVDRALRLAAGLRAQGARPGDRVMSMIPTSADSVIIMAATAFIGAIHVPVNTAYIGYMLEHAINTATPGILVVDDGFVGRLDDIAVPTNLRLVVRGDDDSVAHNRQAASFAQLAAAEPLALDELKPAAWDETAMLLFTSGTTGASKAVIIPWYHLYLSSIRMWQSQELDENTRFYCPWPINHVTGAGAAYMVALLGGALILREKWSTSNFVSDVIDYRCNLTDLMAEMVFYFERLEGLEQTDLTHVFIAPVTESIGSVLKTLGIRYVTTYNSTEINSPIGSVGYEPVPVGSCGVLRPGADVRLVDENGNDVPQGMPGELLLRTDDPAALNGGYWGMPDKTEEAWLGGWFHTGDVLRVDADGYFYFVSRLKDRIKVRGENVNPDEVDLIVLGHEGVEQCSTVGVPASAGGDEIWLFVVPVGDALDQQELAEFCEHNLPKFMRPTHVVFATELPMTPTGKIQRSVLRDRVIGGEYSRTP